MAAPTNTVTTLNSIGNREDLEDTIYRVAPEATPFMSNIGSAKATAVLHEWQTETLAAANGDNAQLEGGDVGTADAGNLTTRVSNYNQIFSKTAVVSNTQNAVKSAGRSSDMNRQIILKGKEMKTDMESAFIRNGASNAQSGGTARKCGGALAWLTSNTSVGAGGSNGGFGSGVVAAATNGTQRALTEAQLKTALASAFNNGGRPSQLYMGATQKQEFSAFTGIAQIRNDAPGKKMAVIIGAADVYVSDFGELAAIPHPYGLTRDVLGIDPDMWAVGTLRGVSTQDLSTTGDSVKKQILAEKTLVCRNEKANLAIRDLN